jgi:hypothetical protein
MADLGTVHRHHNGPPDSERIELAAPKGRGRPSLCTPETVDRICDRLADGGGGAALGRPCGPRGGDCHAGQCNTLGDADGRTYRAGAGRIENNAEQWTGGRPGSEGRGRCKVGRLMGRPK